MLAMWLEISATTFGLLQGILVMFNKRSNWIAYVIQMAFMLAFSAACRLYGDVLNSCIYLIVGIVGFIIWNKKDERKIKECTFKERILYIIVIVVGTLIGYFILKQTNDPLPLLDSLTTISSFVATYYMLIKKIDTWFIWFLNDILYAIEYLVLPEQAIYLFILNIIWTFLAVFSYINWRKIMMEEKKNEK